MRQALEYGHLELNLRKVAYAIVYNPEVDGIYELRHRRSLLSYLARRSASYRVRTACLGQSEARLDSEAGSRGTDQILKPTTTEPIRSSMAMIVRQGPIVFTKGRWSYRRRRASLCSGNQIRGLCFAGSVSFRRCNSHRTAIFPGLT